MPRMRALLGAASHPVFRVREGRCETGAACSDAVYPDAAAYLLAAGDPDVAEPDDRHSAISCRLADLRRPFVGLGDFLRRHRSKYDRTLTMRSIIVAIALMLFYLAAIFATRAHAEPAGGLYAFCDAEWKEPCATKALMLKDVCEDTIRTYTDGSKRFSCAPVNAETRDAYLKMIEPYVRDETFQAWREGR